MTILLKLKNNFIITLLFFAITIISQGIFYGLNDSLTLQIPISKYIALFIILFIFSFIRQLFWRFLSMGFIFILSYFQMLHLEFFGLPVHASEIYLLFTQVGEIAGTLKEDFYIFITPTLIFFPLLVLLYFLNQKIKPQVTTRFLYLLFIFYFIYNPARTFVTGNNWGRQPSTQEFDGMNIYISFSYFLGKVLPFKLSNKTFKDYRKEELKLTPTPPPKRNIIVVQGESLTPFHMNLYGYKRDTTPFLSSLKDDPHFIHRQGISSGVSTDISVAFFMNTAYGLDGNRSVYTSRHCLFRLAFEQKFETYFYSAQSQQQLRYITNSICPKYIQHYKNLEDIQPDLQDENKADDHKLIDELEKINLAEGNKFIILHQRGSHSPYNMRFNELTDKFSEENAHSPKAMQVNYYDNSVYHFDLFMQRLVKLVQQQKTPTTIFVLSDHGEGLGETGYWGHGMLKRPAFEIPLLFYTHLDNELNTEIQKLQLNPTHFNMSLMITYALGYKANRDITKTPSNYIILGNDMDGFAGYLELNFENGKLENFKRKDI